MNRSTMATTAASLYSDAAAVSKVSWLCICGTKQPEEKNKTKSSSELFKKSDSCAVYSHSSNDSFSFSRSISQYVCVCVYILM
jgi:hypothetical protein